MANFVSYSDAQALMTKIGQKFSALTGAYIPRGSSAFASLPATLTSSMLGYVYNVTDDFTTDARFVEGAGIDYPAGSNVVVVDTDTTGSSPDYKFDVLGGFVDLSAIEQAIDDISGMIADEFDESNAYAIGDVVVHEYGLYKFTSAHTASDPWDATEVSTVTVEDLIDLVLTTANSNIATAKATVEALMADEFAAATAYVVGDIVTHEDGLYKFKAAHTAGNPWDATEVDAVQMTDLLDAIEPDSLTPQQILDLEGLLD